MLEKELREPVIAWASGLGYQCCCEFMLSGYCDVVGGIFAHRETRLIPPLIHTIAIELKLSNCAQVIYQARTNRFAVDWSFCAMPHDRVVKMRQATLRKFRDASVGLLAVDETCSIVVPPAKGNARMKIESRRRKKLWRRLQLQNRKDQENGIAEAI